LAEEVVEGSRFGMRVAALVSYLRTSLRLPLELIQAYLVSVPQLKKEYAEQVEVVGWCEQLKGLYEAGCKVVARKVSQAAREYTYQQLVAAVQRLELLYSEMAEHPCHAKAQLILRHQDELFQ
jgi:hypothetical protein